VWIAALATWHAHGRVAPVLARITPAFARLAHSES
jgi:hypothetical protein